MEQILEYTDAYFILNLTEKMVKDLSTVEFEGYKFKVPGDSENYLTSQYGDYMQLPPFE